ncbi:MAG: site-2 protease family protein [Spirochaetota bacterium]
MSRLKGVLLLNLSLAELAIIIPVILVSLTVHELAHASVSLLLGDDTAKLAGRVTLNPIRHVDPFGFLMLVVVGFGWAKPVTFDRTKLRKPVRDEILVALAGPLSNLVLAFAGALAIRWAVFSGAAGDTAINALVTFCLINIALAIFNSLPIPPLDGSHLYTSFLTDRHAGLARALTRYGFLVIIVLLLARRAVGVDLLPIGRLTQAVFGGMLSLVGVE